MPQILICECGHRWQSTEAARDCPVCHSAKVTAHSDATMTLASPSTSPDRQDSQATEAMANTMDLPSTAPVDQSATLPVDFSGTVRQQEPVSAPDDMTLDRPQQPRAKPTGGPNAVPTFDLATEALEAGVLATQGAAPGSPTVSLPGTAGGGRAPTRQKQSSADKTPPERRRSRIEEYELLGVLGRGGMGIVHKARHIRLDRLVALKMILAGAHAGAAHLARFQTEAEAVARLQHPNIVQIYDIGEHKGQPFFALEYVDGGSLQQRLDGTPLPVRTAASLIATLARAVDYAHQRGIVHRDLKPANILLAGGNGQGAAVKSKETAIKGRETSVATAPREPVSSAAVKPLSPGPDIALLTPKITDFGLAKRTDDDSGQTGTGDILGTPSYMSPEQATGKNQTVGPPADIYSLGAILYDLLTGRPPFRGETILDTLQQVQAREPVPPTRFQPKVPRDLETICLKCLEKDPAKRYATAGALADDLQRFLDDQPIVARPTPWWERVVKWGRRRPAVAALLATLAFVLTGAFIGMFSLWQTAESQRQDAILARNESDTQKQAAIAARDDAERQRDRAEKNLQQAFRAGDDLLTRVAEERLLKVPQLEGLRKELLEKAQVFYERFYNVEGNTPAVRFQVASARRRLADILELFGKRTEAKTAYETSVALLGDLATQVPQNREYRHELAVTHINFAIVQRALDQPGPAEHEYVLALGLLQKLHEDYPLEVAYERQLAVTNDSLADLLQRDPTRKGDAEEAYGKALAVHRKLHLEYPKNRDYELELAQVLGNFGAWRLAGGSMEDAEKTYAESLDLWTDLANQEGDNPRDVDGRADALLNIAVVWQGAHPAKADEAYRQATALSEKLVLDYPRTADYRNDLARGYTQLAALVGRDPKQADEATAIRQKAIAQWEKLIEQDPRFADYRSGLIGCLRDEADSQLSLGQRAQAVEWAEKAVEQRKQQVAAFPERIDLQLALARGELDLGQLYGQNRQSDREENTYKEVLKLQDDIVAKTKSSPPGLAQVMADASFNLGGIRGDRKQFAEALPWLQKAVEYQSLAFKENPANASAKLTRYAQLTVNVQIQLKDYSGASATAAQLEPVLREMKDAKGADLFRLAKSIARCLPLSAGDEQKKYSDQVVSLLQAAVQQGFRDTNALQEAVFVPLRGRADYDQLVSQVEKK